MYGHFIFLYYEITSRPSIRTLLIPPKYFIITFWNISGATYKPNGDCLNFYEANVKTINSDSEKIWGILNIYF